jgi:preprotein translocase subunit SecG
MEMPGWMKWTLALLVGFGIIMVGFRWAGWLLTAFFVLNCLVLIIVVLLQSGKAADLAGAFGGAGSQTAFGPRGAASVLSQATTWCAVMFMVCALAMVVRVDRSVEEGGGGGSVLQQFARPKGKPTPVPVNPTPTPTTPQSTVPQAPAQQPAAPATQPKKP